MLRQLNAIPTQKLTEKQMKYKFVAAYCVYGMKMSPSQANVTIYFDSDVHVFLTSDPTAALEIVDRQHAIGTAMLHGLVGLQVVGDPRDAWKVIARESIDSRQNQYRDAVFVIIEVEGDIDVEMPDHCKKLNDYKICFDAYDKKVVTESAYPNVASALAALRLAGDTDYRFERVMSDSYLIDDQEKVIHSISFNAGGEATVSRVVSDDQIATMREFITPLRNAPELAQPIDLHAQSLNRQETKLRAFMAAWNALELFVKEAKAKYGPLWDAERKDVNTPRDRKLTLDGVPGNESSIARTFGKIACYLGVQDTAADIDEFIKLKDIRNGLSHELKDSDLPIDRVHQLLDRYLKQYLRYR